MASAAVSPILVAAANAAKDPVKNAEALERLRAQIMDLLRHEAAINLSRQAEAHSTVELTTEGEFTRKWFGCTIDRQDTLTQLKARRIAVELRLRQTREARLVADIREDVVTSELLDAELMHLEHEADAVDDAFGTLMTDWETETERLRAQLVDEEAERLLLHYQALVDRMPFSVWHPAVPDAVRRWARNQLKKTQQPLSRLYIYLAIRECVFHEYQIGGPVEDTRPLHTLEQIGLPRSKREARDDALLAAQFCHANGDRRVARDTAMTRLHADRLATVREGRVFTESHDYNTSDYDGLPTLEALAPVTIETCNQCAQPIIDFIQPRTADEHHETGFRYVRACGCPDATELLSDLKATRDDVAYAVHLDRLRKKQHAPATVSEATSEVA